MSTPFECAGVVVVEDGALLEELDQRSDVWIKPEYRGGEDRLWHWSQGTRGCIPLNDGVKVRSVGHARVLTDLRLRSKPGMSGKILEVVKAGEHVALSGGYRTVDGARWRSVINGPVVGWMAENYLSMTFSPDVTHYYPWYLERTDVATVSEVAGAVDAILRDPRSWNRAGVMPMRVMDPVKASCIIHVLKQENLTCGVAAKPGASCSKTSGTISQVQINAVHWGQQGWIRAINHEMGHAMFAAADTYNANTAGIDPATSNGIMGNSYQPLPDGTGYNLWPDMGDIESVKLWLQGRATQIVQR